MNTNTPNPANTTNSMLQYVSEPRKRTTNAEARHYTSVCRPFKGSNLWGEWEHGKYVVYSYGRHYIAYMYDPDTNLWFGNENSYSRSTARQIHQALPTSTRGEIKYLSQRDLQTILFNDYITLAASALA